MVPLWKFDEKQRITTPELEEILKEEVLKYWNSPKKLFPGPQPVSIEYKDIEVLRKKPYVACAKLDGERFFLYSTQVPIDLQKPNQNLLNISFLINRNFQFFITTLNWPEEMYKNKILLDGELIEKTFIVHDSIIINGNIINKEPWDTRWHTANKFLSQYGGKHHSLTIKLKKFYTIPQLNILFRDMKEQTTPSDGIIFYPIKEPIGYRHQPTLLKWKPPGKHTMDFKIIIEGHKVKLMAWASGKDIEYKTLPITHFSNIEDLSSGDIIEFTTINKGRQLQFKPIKKRTDKPVGNSLFTIKKTLLNIKQNIQQKDLEHIFTLSSLTPSS